VRRPVRVPGEFYTVDSYRRAVERACQKAGVLYRKEACMRPSAFVGLVAALVMATSASGALGGEMKFARHEIGRAGDKMGQTSLVDVDKDGDLDWVVGCQKGAVWWFEHRGPDEWVRHSVGEKVLTDVGGTALDVDGDGWVDQVSGGTWFRNTGKPREEAFERFENGAITNSHDNVAADVDGDGRTDIVMISDKSGVFWYTIPADPKAKWTSHTIGPGVHGGVGPRGVADLDGDGDADIVRSTGWFENVGGKGAEWRWHENIAGGHPGRYPDCTKSWVMDVDGDGDADIIMVDADIEAGKGRVHWFENADGKGGRWDRHAVADSKGDLHSLAVADFDGDGDMDIFSGEGPLGGAGPGGKHRWYVWENVDGKGGRWTEHVVLEGDRCHEAVAADVDGDGDIDICSKPWNGDLHIYLENTGAAKKAK
jgi:hypothetical protein